jgi:VCBS repeat-containing protein
VFQADSGSSTYGSWTVDAGGVWSYTVNDANPTVNALNAGDTLSDSFTVLTEDGTPQVVSITIEGANDAPFVDADIASTSALYSSAGGTATLLPLPETNGTPQAVSVPVSWEMEQNTPDIISGNGLWPLGAVYSVGHVSDTSPEGGEMVLMISNHFINQSLYEEAASTTVTGLTIGQQYTFGVYWQEASLKLNSQTNWLWSGGDLEISVDNNVSTTQTFVGNATPATDDWQAAVFTFTASETSHKIVLKSAFIGDTNQGGALVFDAIDDLTTLSTVVGLTPSSGVTLSDIVTGESDVDGGTLRYAITSASESGTSGWQYSTNGGSTWTDMPSVNVSSALLLDGATRVRWTGASGTNTELGVVVVDDTETSATGDFIDVTVRGDDTPYSATISTLSANAAPVVLDLDGDGEISYSVIDADINGDGVDDISNWVGSNDGILFWDKNGDGSLTDMHQWAFTQFGGETDLEGLAAKFDTNHDGTFDAQDNEFAEFGIWQDLNQNGDVDMDEIISLMDAGIESIELTSDGVVRTPVDGVTEHGQTAATMTDGGTMLVVDASFEYQHGADIQNVV